MEAHTQSPSATTPSEADKEADRIRFETELEFVQCLANPFYLQSLAQQGLFEDEAFLNYLAYLSYWHSPRFARFIQYPQALHHLQLLQHDSFRQALKSQNVAQELAGLQLAHWASWREPAGLADKLAASEGKDGGFLVGDRGAGIGAGAGAGTVAPT